MSIFIRCRSNGATQGCSIEDVNDVKLPAKPLSIDSHNELLTLQMTKYRIDATSELTPPKAFNQRTSPQRTRDIIDPLPFIRPRQRDLVNELLDDLTFISGNEYKPFDLFTMLLNFWYVESTERNRSRIKLAQEIMTAQKYATKLNNRARDAKRNFADRLLLALGASKEHLT